MSEVLKLAMPEVDVILLSWNRTEMTIETITNLLEQQDVDLKIWVVDQGSTAENLEKIKEVSQKYVNVHIKPLEQNVGVPGGRNIGMELGSAEYTVSIDNDAVFESPNALAQVVQIFNQNPDIGVVGFRILNFYTGQDDEMSWVYPKTLKKIRNQRFDATCFCGCGHAIRRSVFEKAEGYDADLFFYWEETDFSYRVINLGYRLIYEPSIIVRHKVSPEARVRWGDKRFYYHVRNAIYMYLKYAPKKALVIVRMIGYLVKGGYNRLLPQTMAGIVDGLKMYINLRPKLLKNSSSLYELTPDAKDYLRRNDLQHRGSFLNRIKTDILANLPGSNQIEDVTQSKA